MFLFNNFSIFVWLLVASGTEVTVENEITDWSGGEGRNFRKCKDLEDVDS